MPITVTTHHGVFPFQRRTIEDGTITQDLKSTSSQSYTETRDGNGMPDYKGKIRRGVNATTIYSASFKKLNKPSLHATGTVFTPNATPKTRTRTMFGTPSGWVGAPAEPFGFDLSAAERTAREQFVAKYRKKRTAFQGGVFLGELRKTVQMIRRPAQALREAVDTARGAAKERARREKKPRRVIAATWLEYSFGMKPLINDVKDACSLATAHPFAAFEELSASGRQEIEATRINNEVTYGHTRAKWTQIDEGHTSVKIKGAIRAKNAPPGFPEQLGLSWSNLVPTAWELIPYSFLIDYFTNVGRVIDGISTGTIDLAWGAKMSWKVRERFIAGVHLDQEYLEGFGNSQSRHSGNATGGGLISSASQYFRQPISSVAFGLSDVRFKLPGSGTQWLNIGALIAGRREDHRRYRT